MIIKSGWYRPRLIVSGDISSEIFLIPVLGTALAITTAIQVTTQIRRLGLRCRQPSERGHFTLLFLDDSYKMYKNIAIVLLMPSVR